MIFTPAGNAARLRAILGGGLAALLAGCVPPPSPAPALAAADTAGTLTTRSLSDGGLRDFLRQNLGREPAAWDFESLSWVAFYYQPSLAVARARWAEARAELTAAAARPNPSLSLVPGFSSNAPAGTSPWFPAVNLDFLLETGRKREHRTAAGKSAAEAARLEVVAAVWQVRSELRQALLDLAAGTRRAQLLAAQAELQQQIAGLLQKRLDAGAVSAPEVATVRQAALRAAAAAAEAGRSVPPARNRVAEALGLPLAALEGVTLAGAPVPAEISADALAQARRRSLQNRADILGALARYESVRAAQQLELAAKYPDVHLGPGFQWDQGQDKWSAGLTFELPLFNRHEGPIALARARLEEAAAQVTVVQARALAAIDGAAAVYAGAAEQADRLRTLQSGQDRQLARAQARLQAGGADQVEYLNARLEAAAGELALADATDAAARAAGQLEDALQVPFANLEAMVPPAGPPPPPSSP